MSSETQAANVSVPPSPLEKLTTPDPIWEGMSVFGWSSNPEEILASLDCLLEPATLPDEVPDDVRQQFDTLCRLFRYGVFNYDFCTLASDDIYLVAETAFRRRFLEYYGHRVPLVSRDGTQHAVVEANHYELFLEALRTRNRKRPWLIESKATAQPHDLGSGGFQALLRWAFDEQLLPGRKVQHIIRSTHWHRNFAGHPTPHRLTPPMMAESICTISELIARLWGAETKGGRLFPNLAPCQRILMALGRSPDGLSVTFGPASELAAWRSDHDYEISLILSPLSNDLHNFESGLERTAYPADLLWGPGSWHEAVQYLRTRGPVQDSVDYTDRLFAIRTGEGLAATAGEFGFPLEGLESTRRAQSLAALKAHQQAGCWYLIRCDYPDEAVCHVAEMHVMKQNLTSIHRLRRMLRCDCGVDEIGAELSWAEAVTKVEELSQMEQQHE
jgi:hypothetical protein